MTRLSKRPKRRGGVYGGHDEAFLLSGQHGVPCALTDADDSGDDEAIRAAWNELRPTLLPKWISDRPGTRPYAWWRFEAPERRQRIDGKPHPFDCKERTLHVAKNDNPDFWKRAYGLHWGVPACFIPPFDGDLYRDFMQNILHGRESQIFEPEWNYLQRLGLLLPEDSP
jgi:hypothetical protein